MTDLRISHRANIVAELVERLGNACSDDDGDFLASALMDATSDLEQTALAALREARLAEAMAEGVKQIEADNRARRQRLERKAETIRAAVAQAMQDAGLPKIVSDDLTISFRMGKAPLIIDREPTSADADECLASEQVSYKWDKDALRSRIELGDDIASAIARLGNPAPVLTVRGK